MVFIDGDYVPSGAESDLPSEEESGGESDENYQERSDTEEIKKN
jgi:hypothetical protein